MQMNDRELLARTLQAEAGNQGLPGMIAAGSVVMNRIGSGGYGGNLRDVILKPGQFSAWNSLTGYAGGEQGQDMTSMTPSAEAYKAADTLLAGGYEDPTGGATHYYNPAISQPNWGASAGGSWTEIGDHLFGQADAGRNPNQGVAADAMRAIGRQPRGILEPTQTAETETAPMMQEEQPRGLLEGLGIQRMEEGAEGETGQRFFQRDSFKDTAATLAQGFAALGSNPAVQQFAADVAGQRTEAKAKNKTIDYLRRSGRDDLADAVESGSLGARDAAGILFKQPKDARTSLMKNYEFFIAQGMSPQDAMAAVRSGTTINMGDVGTGNFLYGAKAGLPAGYRLDIRTGEASAIPGGPAAIKAQQEAEAEAQRQATLDAQAGQKETVVAGSIDTLIGQIDKGGIFDLPEAGIVGNVLGRLGVNQDAVDFRNELATVQANIAFDRLQQMREASKTGGALGAVSERELDLLMNAYGNINQSTSPERLKENLRTIKDIMTKIENDPTASQFYYGGGGDSSTQPSGVTVGEPY